MHIGVCLPSSCTAEDLLAMSEHSGKPMQSRSSEVTGVRIPGGDGYKLWNDGTFITML